MYRKCMSKIEFTCKIAKFVKKKISINLPDNIAVRIGIQSIVVKPSAKYN